MKPFTLIVTTTLLWLATTSLLATTVHADKVAVSQSDLGSHEESGHNLVSTVNYGDTHKETERILTKAKKTRPPAMKKGKSNAPSKKPSKPPSKKPSKPPSKKPSNKPSKPPSKKPSNKPSKQPSGKPSAKPSQAPSPVLAQTIIKGPTTLRSGMQQCNADTRYLYCQLHGITDPNCQSTNAVSGPFWFNHDAEASFASFNFQNVLSGDTEDAVCIKVVSDPGGQGKGFLQFWDDVDKKLSDLTSFSFDFLVKSCPIGAPALGTSCLNRIYLGIYTRSAASNTIYYDCRFNYYFATAIPVTVLNTWYSATISTSTTTNVGVKYGPSAPGCPSTNTLSGAASADYVLGTKNTCGDWYSYSINLGDTSGAFDDTNLEVCFKNFRDKIGSKDITYTFQKVTP
jgi:hypothetical protein